MLQLRSLLGDQTQQAWGSSAILRLVGCGVPRVLLRDDLKSAVLERHGDAIRFHPTLIAFAGRYRYNFRPIASRNDKGRIQRAKECTKLDLHFPSFKTDP